MYHSTKLSKVHGSLRIIITLKILLCRPDFCSGVGIISQLHHSETRTPLACTKYVHRRHHLLASRGTPAVHRCRIRVLPNRLRGVTRTILQRSESTSRIGSDFRRIDNLLTIYTERKLFQQRTVRWFSHWWLCQENTCARQTLSPFLQLTPASWTTFARFSLDVNLRVPPIHVRLNRIVLRRCPFST